MFSLRDLISVQQEHKQEEEVKIELPNKRPKYHDRKSKAEELCGGVKNDATKQEDKVARSNKRNLSDMILDDFTRNDEEEYHHEDDSGGILFLDDYDFDDGSVNDIHDYSIENFESSIPILYGLACSARFPQRTADASVSKVGMLETIQELLLPTHKSVFAKKRRFQPQKRSIKRLGERVQVMETMEATRQRTLKKDRQLEMHYIRRRWKKRRFDYKNETDAGKVLETQARRHLGEKIRKEQHQRKRKRRLKEENEMEGIDINGIEDDDSLNEQKLLLDRLTQNSTEEMIQTVESKEADPSVPYKQQMSYWEYGAYAPKKRDLEFDCFRDISHLVRSDIACREMDETKEGGLKVFLPDILPSTSKNKREDFCKQQRYFFPSNEVPLQSIDFNHFKYLRAMAFRFLCGGTRDAAMETRLIRHLHSSSLSRNGLNVPVAFYNRQASLLAIAQERGENLLLYFRKKWINSEIVVRRLLLCQGDSSSIVCRSINPTRIRKNEKNLRSKVQKSCSQIGSGDMRWLPDDCGDKGGVSVAAGIETESVGSNDETVSSFKQKRITQVEDHDGRDDIAPSPNDKDEAWGRESIEKDHPTDTMNHTFVSPNSSFAYVPGTSPPVPPFPLGVLGLMFGPVDRHFKHFHTNQIDEATFHITISALLSRFAVGRQRRGDSDATERTSALKDQIERFARDYASIHESKSYKLQARLAGEQDIPLVAYYKGLMGVCRVMSNMVPQDDDDDDPRISSQQQVVANTGVDVNDEDDDNRYPKNKAYCDRRVLDAAEKIYTFANKKIHHNGLLRFPRFKVVYAISAMCRQLPASAAEIMSRATDSRNMQTILDLFKEMLERLEAEDMIVQDRRFSGDNAMVVGELEYTFYNAAKTFQKCVRADPLNPDYHLWLIGSLASCLLLSSGNLIGDSGGHRFPSARKVSRIAVMHNNTRNHLPHEARTMLSKFSEVRLELSKAIRHLFALTRHQNGPRAHQAIASLLGWSQLIALLAGDKLESHLEEISNLHRYHVLHWSLDTRLYMKCDDGQSEGADRLSLRALELENEPGNIERWRKFVKELGLQLGELVADDANNRSHRVHCNELHCNECKFIRKPLLVDHKSCAKTKSDTFWWGKDRDWWISGLLQINPANQLDRNKKRNQLKSEAVLKRLEARLQDLHIEKDDKYRCTKGTKQSEVSRSGNPSGLAWLPLDMEVPDYTEISVENRSQSYGSRLPQNVSATTNCKDNDEDEDGDIGTDPLPSWIPCFSGDNATKFELLCYRILIYCKLRHVDGSALEVMIHPLVKACWDVEDIDDQKDEFRALLWLCEKTGLDVPGLIRHKFKKYNITKTR